MSPSEIMGIQVSGSSSVTKSDAGSAADETIVAGMLFIVLRRHFFGMCSKVVVS